MLAPLTRPVRFLPRGLLDVLLQVAIVYAAYTAYRLSRGAIDDPLTTSAAFANADWIIRAERAVHLDVERVTQSLTSRVPGLHEISAFLYINVQTTVTFTALAYVYGRHGSAFGFVRNTFVLTWGLAVVIFLLVPTAPPRLVPGLGITDEVAAFTGVDPTAPRISKYYNPYAAVPSLHVGVATIVGLSLSRLVRPRALRIGWALYPLLVTFLVLATGNHYLLDAVAGALTVGVAALGALALAMLRPGWRFVALPRERVPRSPGRLRRAPDPEAHARAAAGD